MAILANRHWAGMLACALAPIAGGCEAPTASGDDVFVSVEADGKPIRADAVLVRGNRVVVAARAWRRIGERDSTEMPNATIDWRSSSPTDAIVAAIDHHAAEVTGVRSTPTPIEITATAVGFEGSRAGRVSLRVAEILEVDSVRPRQVRFGQRLTAFGVGVDAIGFATLGGGQLFPDTASFKGLRGGLGRIEFWVPPPASSSPLLAVGPGVFVAAPESTLVDGRDIYEPNDSTPWIIDLDGPPPVPGNPAIRLINPALAFEDLRLDSVAYDWYRFTTAQPNRAYTFIIDPPGGGGGNRTVMASPNLASGPSDRWNWAVGPGRQVCKNVDIFPRSAPQDRLIFAFKRLLSGGIDLVSEYLIEGPYSLVVLEGYFTVRADVGADRFEENDACDFADQNFADSRLRIDLTTPFADTLTIDNPGDVDWFRIRVPGPGPRVLSVRIDAPGPIANPVVPVDKADLGLFVFAVGPPIQLVSAQQKREDNAEALGITIPPGDYYLMVMDQGGAPSRYALCASVTGQCTLPPVAAVPPALVRWPGLERLAPRQGGRGRRGPGGAR
jgi:hypothetical protein